MEGVESTTECVRAGLPTGCALVQAQLRVGLCAFPHESTTS
jgi:hypothetical protein